MLLAARTLLPTLARRHRMRVPGSTLAMASSAGDTSTVACYVTCPDFDTGKKLGGGLVEAKLAACVNIIPSITSIYLWEGKVNYDPEHLLMIKTQASLVPELTQYVQENHPYDVPEVIATPIVGGSAEYISWVSESTKTAPP
mmetsp:Transcript_29491/g.96036  ORF Transcript_29491/g.96036 Transcript_29491/m.96036 type:complete len:142 (+) Transcript_29491:57-482(+)